MTATTYEDTTVEISFKTKDHPESRTIEYPMPETLQGLLDKFGEEAVAGAAIGSFVISIQALCRRHIEKSDDEIAALALSWNPNERASATPKTTAEKAASALSKLSPEERAELLRRFAEAA
jgi:hypothetical protein